MQMADNNRCRGWPRAVASAALLLTFAAIAPTASAQERRLEGNVGPAKTVDLATAPELPAAPRPEGLAINRPTLPTADYIAAKNATAAHAPGQAKPGAAPPVSSNVTLYAQVGSTNETQTTGGSRSPPDGDIATSSQWMVQVNNDVVVMLNWFTNAFVSKRFSTFFGDSTNFIFDPRVIYDPYWNRFVVLADGCTNCGNTTSNASTFEVAVSQTGDPSGAWYVYQIWPGTSSGDFVDFPQLGMDLNSLIFTYNDFEGGGGSIAWALPIAKAYLYNGLSPPFTSIIGAFFGGGACTMAPPYVLDSSATDYLLVFCPGDTKVYIGSLTNTGLSTPNLVWDNTVNVALNGMPPQAAQPASAGRYALDTGDNRFENRSLQVGSRIINTATINYSGYPAPAWYNFNIYASPHTLVSEGAYYASASSYDWHPSINANTIGATGFLAPLGEIFTTWMSTDPTNNLNVQLRAGGGLGDNPPTGPSGIAVYTSSIPLTNQTDSHGIHRTGDYSYIATYPAAALGCTKAGELGILEGETSGPAAGTWGTHVAIVKHC
jgi:hypothetical protein